MAAFILIIVVVGLGILMFSNNTPRYYNPPYYNNGYAPMHPHIPVDMNTHYYYHEQRRQAGFYTLIFIVLLVLSLFYFSSDNDENASDYRPSNRSERTRQLENRTDVFQRNYYSAEKE